MPATVVQANRTAAPAQPIAPRPAPAHPPAQRTSFPGPAAVRLGGKNDNASIIQRSRPRVPSLWPPSAPPAIPTFTVTSFPAPQGSGNAQLTSDANGVRVDSPVFSSSAEVRATGNVANWRIGYIQTIFAHFLRNEYLNTTAEWNVPTPIRDAVTANSLAPWYFASSNVNVFRGDTPTSVGMIDRPWHETSWNDLLTNAPNSLVRTSRRLMLVAWLIAQNQVSNLTIFLKNVRWEINFIVNVDRRRPFANRAVNAGPGMTAPVVGEGQGSLAPTFAGAIYNAALNSAASRRLSARAGSLSTSTSRPALDGDLPFIRLNRGAGAAPAMYLPRQISAVGCGAGAPLPPAVQLRLGQQFSADLSTVRVHTDDRARQATRGLSARALTRGNHILLGPGEQPTDLKLMAHEVAHVIQQRGGTSTPQHSGLSTDDRFEQEAERAASAAQSGGKVRIAERTGGARVQALRIPIISDAIDWIKDRVWELLERYAPSLVPILRQGVLNWLKEKLGGALQGIIDFAARPVRAIGNVVSGVRQHFGNLVVWIRDAAARIARNDCGPISEAADKIHQVFEGLTAPVVERVKHYAGVVKGFFQGLWDRFGAPIWDLLRSIGGAIWEEVQRIGRWIWEKTQPVRDWLSRAWRWLKDLIGIGEGDEGQNGILQWFQRKASAAWDWVMARIEPFKRPLLIIAGVLVMLSPAGPIIAIGAAGAGILRGIQWIRQNLRSRTATVRQQSFLRGTILPAILGAIDRVSGVVNSIANGITGALRRVVAGVDNLAAAVSGIPILSFAGGFIGWLAEGFRGLLDWAIVGVQGVANGIQNGLQSVGGFARRLIDFLEEIERLLRNFFRLAGGVFRRIWNAIPKCIRDPFVDFLIPLILRQIPFFSELASTPEAWQQTRTQVNTLLVQVFVNFDLIGAMKTVFGLVVRVLRIPVDLMGQLLDKAAQAWDLVLASPMRFVTNALKAILRGVGFFARNFLSHLWFGIQGWLLNAVEQSGTGIRPPASWEPRAIFGFVLDLLGISLDHVLDLLARRVGRPVVDRIRGMINFLTGAWEWVKVAIEEGPAGLWRMVVERLGNLARMVLEGAVGWVMTRIFAIVSARLAAMAASAGLSSVLEAVVAVYAAIRTAMEYARRIIQMLINVFDGIIQIAGGVLDPAARTLESAFRNAMPIVIGFLANYAGLGGIGARIREVVLDIRERVDNAILWLIDRALAAGRWLLDRLRAGVAAIGEWWRLRKQFRTRTGETHTLYFQGEGRAATLMIATVPAPFRTWIATFPSSSSSRFLAERLMQNIENWEQDTITNNVDHRAQIEQALEDLVPIILELMQPRASRSLPSYTGPAFSGTYQGFGRGMRVTINTSDPKINQGTPPNPPNLPLWDTILDQRLLKTATMSYYRLGHLLNQRLGGTGILWENLTPLSTSGNSAHFQHSERLLTDRRSGSVRTNADFARAALYVVTPAYGRQRNTARENDVNNATGPSWTTARKMFMLSLIRVEQFVPTRIIGVFREAIVGPDNRVTWTTETVFRAENDIQDDKLENYNLRNFPGGPKSATQ